jgi:hypothetical protein
MGRPRTHSHPSIGTRYGDVVVTGAAFSEPRGVYKGRLVIVWRIPCTCLLCDTEFSPLWNNLHRGLVAQCVHCKRKADSARFTANSKELGELRRKDEYRWYNGTPYVYAIAYEERHVLKIGYGSTHPVHVMSSGKLRFKKQTGLDVSGRLFWYGVPAVFADEAILQALFTKRHGAAFSTRTRMSEWVNYDSEERALSLLRAAFKFSQENFPG